jgi:selenocysteine lyase/cysteine desulfurase
LSHATYTAETAETLRTSDDKSMIENQRHLFDIPEDVAYLNCAYMSPLMLSVQEAGRGGIAFKGRPWTITPEDFFTRSAHARQLFAQLVNGDPRSVALVPAASYGLAVAARNLPVGENQEILVLEDQFPSNVYTWRELTARNRAHLRTIKRAQATNADNSGTDWTSALLEAIGEQTAIVAAGHCHWTDGSLVDLMQVSERCREVGAALVLDITQSGGAWPLDVSRVRPDFMVCACYKWLLGPYTLGFLYVDPKWHGGEPLEHNWIARKGSHDFGGLVAYQDDYQPGAERYDVGERANFHLMPMAAAALEQILEWTVDGIAETLEHKTRAIAERAAALGLKSDPPHLRAGHFLGVRFPQGIRDGLLADLAEQKIFVSMRGDAVRITPHLYNTDGDVDRLFEALEREL